jgi:AcrR family transcriptional regulator
MVNEILSTEEKILEAAKTVFHKRGFEGARMQEIADEAGVNKALLHYYYRKKEVLFQAVFEDAFRQLVSRLNDIFLSEKPLQEKVGEFITYYIDFLSHNSYLPIFILHGMHTHPERLKELLKKINLSPRMMMESIRQQARDELGIEINPIHMYVNILALCIFPVVARPVIQAIFGMSDEEMQQFYQERKVVVPEFIGGGLKK